MTNGFSTATAVHRLGDQGDSETGRASYSAEIQDGWDIGGNTNGGFLMAIVVRAMSQELQRPALSVTAHFLAPGRPGEARVEVTTIRSGSRMATARASLYSGGRQIIEVLGTFGSASAGGFEHFVSGPPSMPSFDDPAVMPSAEVIAASPPVFSKVDARLAPPSEGFRLGQPSGVAEMVGWFDWPDGEPIDDIGLMFVADAFAPPIFNLDAPVAWVPTLELTVHVRARPAPGPLRCRFVSGFIGDGLLNEDGEIWDSQDRLVCQSRQIALVPRSD